MSCMSTLLFWTILATKRTILICWNNLGIFGMPDLEMIQMIAWIFVGAIISETSYAEAQTTAPYNCTENDIFSRTPDECVYFECQSDVAPSGTLRPCPPGSAVPSGYVSGVDTPCTQGSSKCSLCSLFPMGYLAPRMWYYGRLNIGNGNYLYWRQTFFRSNMTANEPLIVYYCVDQESDSFNANLIYTSRLRQPTAQTPFLTYQCLENTLLGPDLLLQRQGALVLYKPTAEDCKTNMATERWFRLLFPFPANEVVFTLPEVPCPIPDGEYAMTTIVDDSGTRLCENQPDSTVMVTGSSFMINYCSEASGASYRMTCHRGLLATDLGEPDDSNGNLVVISRPHPYPDGHPRMMCMRYHVDGDAVYLSMAIKTYDTLDCAYNVTYRTHGTFDDDMETAFSFELTSKTTTTAPTTTPTTVHTVTSPPPEITTTTSSTPPLTPSPTIPVTLSPTTTVASQTTSNMQDTTTTFTTTIQPTTTTTTTAKPTTTTTIPTTTTSTLPTTTTTTTTTTAIPTTTSTPLPTTTTTTTEPPPTTTTTTTPLHTTITTTTEQPPTTTTTTTPTTATAPPSTTTTTEPKLGTTGKQSGASTDSGNDAKVVLIAIITTVSVITLLLIITIVTALVMRSGYRKNEPTWLNKDSSKSEGGPHDQDAQSGTTSTLDKPATRYHEDTFMRNMDRYTAVANTPTPSISGQTVTGKSVSGDYTTYISYMKQPE